MRNDGVERERKYSISEKEKLGKLYMKNKGKYNNHEIVQNYNSEKGKFTSSSSPSGFLSKAVREMYPTLSKKSSESREFKKALQVYSKKKLPVLYQSIE